MMKVLVLLILLAMAACGKKEAPAKRHAPKNPAIDTLTKGGG